MFYDQAFIAVDSDRETDLKCHRHGFTNKGNIENVMARLDILKALK